MAKKTNPEEVQQLIDMGKEKGFLTYDEVNDILPANMVSSEQLEDVMSMFGEMDIEVVDSDSKVSSSSSDDDIDGDDDKDDGDVELEAGTLGRTSDPVRMYLREMGQVALLTREGEVEIAKRIEEGEALVAKVVMRTPIAAREVINLLQRLEKGQISVSEVTKDYDEEEGGEAEEKQRERLTELYQQVKPLDEKLNEVQNELAAEPPPTARKQKSLEKKENELRDQLIELLRQAARQDTAREYAQVLVSVPAAAKREGVERKAWPSAELVEPLSPRELQVLALIAAGASNPEIARDLVISINTVKRHVTNIFGKLGATSRTQAVARGRELELVE